MIFRNDKPLIKNVTFKPNPALQLHTIWPLNSLTGAIGSRGPLLKGTSRVLVGEAKYSTHFLFLPSFSKLVWESSNHRPSSSAPASTSTLELLFPQYRSERLCQFWHGNSSYINSGLWTGLNLHSFSCPGGDSTGFKKKSNCMEVYEKMTLLLTWFLTSVNSFLLNFWSQSLVCVFCQMFI